MPVSSYGKQRVSVGTTTAGVHQDAATLVNTALVSLGNTHSSGESTFFVHYQTKGSQERWWVTNGKFYGRSGPECNAHAGAVLNKEDASDRMIISPFAFWIASFKTAVLPRR